MCACKVGVLLDDWIAILQEQDKKCREIVANLNSTTTGLKERLCT